MKIAIYARVSTEKQEKQETIKSQLDALRSHAIEKNTWSRRNILMRATPANCSIAPDWTACVMTQKQAI